MPHPRGFTLLLCVLLAACAGVPAPTPDLSWEEHQARVLAVKQWSLQGRLNIRGERESNTVNINWRQQGDGFLINLSGTLGLGAVVISGDGEGVVMEQAGEAPVRAASLAELSIDYLGYRFPADALYYWVRGVPAPLGPARIELNENALLGSLSQADRWGNVWSLDYDRYRGSDGYVLPGRIVMKHPDYRLTFLIGDWRILAAGAS